MCLNVFMPFIDKYITIGGEGGVISNENYIGETRGEKKL